MGLMPTVSGLLAGTLLLGLGVAFTTPALASLTVSRAPASERGAALGTFSLFIDLAFGAGTDRDGRGRGGEHARRSPSSARRRWR